MAPHTAASVAPRTIELQGVRTHNLKNIDVSIPMERLTVITGLSGSGKSSLAFDTLYAEGQRRYVESLSAYTRQFLERMKRPDVDRVSGIPPAIAALRKPPAKTSRSTVGTVTEILDYLKMLFARVATLRCVSCDREVALETTIGIADRMLREHAGDRVTIGFPIPEVHGEATLDRLRRDGYYRITRDGRSIDDLHDGDVALDGDVPYFAIADRLRIDDRAGARLTESLDAAFRGGEERATLFPENGERVPLARGFHCAHCDRAYGAPGPQHFSFNSPIGACPACRGFGDVIDVDPARVIPDPSLSIADGAVAPWQSGKSQRWQKRLIDFAAEAGIPTDRPYRSLSSEERNAIFEGTKGFPGVRGFFARLEKKIYKLHIRVLLSRYRRYVPCDACGGARLKPESLAYHIANRSIADVCEMPIDEAAEFFHALGLTGQAAETAAPLLEEIVRRLDVMRRAGLDYLSLSRPSRSLSGGEYQRIILAGALGSGLVGTLYVLDEPSVGLHARDADRLMSILEDLRDAGNTVVVVEHDRDIIERADHVIDLGPGAGEHGGRVVFEGSPKALRADTESETAAFITRKKRLPGLDRRDLGGAPRIGVRGARAHNLKRLDVDIPLGGLVCVTGVSGSGKSTLVEETLYRGYRASRGEAVDTVGRHDRLVGMHHISDVVMVDQSPIGKTPRSNPVTYVKAFDGVRRLFAATREAGSQGLAPGDFSFNIPGGRCETCEGAGELRIELQFLADVFVTCESCRGTRYTDRVLDVRYRGKTITEVLAMSVNEAVGFFGDTPQVARPLWQLRETGLGYLRLGQAANTLSGGEAQRLKIAHHLARRVSGHALFILDEPTTGLHVADVGTLLGALERLIERGHSVLLVEHNLDVVARADHIIDLGPEGGAGGGRLVATGTPEELAKNSASITGRHLAAHVERWGRPIRPERRASKRPAKRKTKRRR